MGVRVMQYLVYGVKVDYDTVQRSRFNDDFWETYYEEHDYSVDVPKVGELQFVPSIDAGYYMIGLVLESGNKDDGMVRSFCLNDITLDEPTKLKIEKSLLDENFVETTAQFHLATVYN